MKEKRGFWIDFSSSVYVYAENEEKAREYFWNTILSSALEHTEIDSIEESEEIDYEV